MITKHLFCSLAALALLTISAQATPGCTKPAACNYDPAATADDGSCEYASCSGCTYPEALNYDPLATRDDGTCLITLHQYAMDEDYDGMVDTWHVLLTLQRLGVTSDVPFRDCHSPANVQQFCDTGVLGWLPANGCTDPSKCNYQPNATSDDGSCADDCAAGCTYTCATNYDPLAIVDDQSCVFPTEEVVTVDFDNDGDIRVFDLLMIIANLGLTVEWPPCGE